MNDVDPPPFPKFSEQVEAVLLALEEVERKELARHHEPEVAEKLGLDAAHRERREQLLQLLQEQADPAAVEPELIEQMLQQIATVRKHGFALPSAPPNRRARRAAASRARKT